MVAWNESAAGTSERRSHNCTYTIEYVIRKLEAEADRWPPFKVFSGVYPTIAEESGWDSTRDRFEQRTARLIRETGGRAPLRIRAWRSFTRPAAIGRRGYSA